MACAVGPVLWSLDMACAVVLGHGLCCGACAVVLGHGLRCGATPSTLREPLRALLRCASPLPLLLARAPCNCRRSAAVRDHCASCCAAITRSPPHPALGAVFTGICAQNSLWMQPPPPPALVLVKETLLFWERVRDAHCCLTLTCQRFSHVRGMPVLLLPCRLHRW